MKNKLIRQIMEHEVFRQQPPVLVDVGASGEIHEEWAEIAPYSLCIAFDGDDREFKSDKSSESGYRELILYHRVLTAKEAKPCLNIWKFMVHVLLKPGLENFEHYFTSM